MQSDKMNIAIIGMGVVGTAIYCGMNSQTDHVILGYDIDETKTKNTYDEVIETDLVFICVPTPLVGINLNTGIVEVCLVNLADHNYHGVVVVKSTLSLGTMETLRSKFKYLKLIYSPEFLRSKTAKTDFMDMHQVVCAGNADHILVYKKALFWVADELFKTVDDVTAELIKLVLNSFAATKVSFINEIEEISLKCGANINHVFDVLRGDLRCGELYSYPLLGPFGGVCLVKDTTDLAHYLESNTLLHEVLNVNKRTKKRYAN